MKQKIEENKQRITGDDILTIVIHIILGILAIVTLYPFVYVVASSLSSGRMVDMGEVLLFPKEFTIDAYAYVLKQKVFWTSYANTIFYTVVGTAWSMLLSATGAYALSKKD